MLNTSSTISPNNYEQTHKFAAVSPTSQWQGRSPCRTFRTPIKNWSSLCSAVVARERNDACWSIWSTKWNLSVFQAYILYIVPNLTEHKLNIICSSGITLLWKKETAIEESWMMIHIVAYFFFCPSLLWCLASVCQNYWSESLISSIYRSG